MDSALDPKLGIARNEVKEANDRYESTRKKLKVLRGRVATLRNELSQIEPKIPQLEAQLAETVASLESARIAFRTLKDERDRRRRAAKVQGGHAGRIPAFQPLARQNAPNSQEKAT